MFHLSDYEYALPEELIAQHPAARRDRSRLLRLDSQAGCISHHRFDEIADLLRPDDLLVVNNTAVVPARLVGKKPTGGRVEVLILDYPGLVKSASSGRAESDCLIKASKAPRPGTRIEFAGDLGAEVIEKIDGMFRVRFFGTDDMDRMLSCIGSVPLPPYIRRDDAAPLSGDCSAYQTVYARVKGAVAAPTAGLHFSPELLEKIRSRKIPVEEITLHVGYGTFFPVKVEDIRAHRIHSEAYRISSEAAERIADHRSSGGRLVAVGTTCVRTLEYAAEADGSIRSGSGVCDLFIYPGYRFKAVGAMITNFHLPRSTLIMLVSAFAGREAILEAYREAVKERYRFFSYGDAMFIQ